MARTARRFTLVVTAFVAVAGVGGGAAWLVQRGTFESAADTVPGAVGPGQSLPAPAAASTSSGAAGGGAAVPRPAEPSLVTAPAPGQTVATDSPGATGGGQVQVVVTYADYDAAGPGVEVDGFASGVVESGGTCRVTLTNGTVTLTAQAAATPSASTTSCGGVVVRDPRLTAGQWRAVLAYSSSTSSGASAAVPVQVP